MSKEKMVEVCTEIAEIFCKHNLTNIDVLKILTVMQMAQKDVIKENAEKLEKTLKKIKGDK